MRLMPVAAVLFLALALSLVAPAHASERAVAQSEHYELSTSGPQAEADEWVRMLEAAWPHYAAFFDAEPKLKKGERLHVALFDDEAAWRQAIVDGGGSPPGAAGYYCPVAKTAYLKRQPSVWYTRTLLLHEAGHQFHYLARTGNDKPTGNWYVEGVAEHLGSHTWDGETLHVGVTPLVSLEDRAGKALGAVVRDDFSVADLVEAPTASRPEAMFLVRYLAEQHGKRFGTLAKKLDRGSNLDAKGFRKALGKAASKEDVFLAAWTDWLRERQEPFVSVFVEWDTRGPTSLHGTGKAMSLCRTRDTVREVAATVRRRGDRPLRAGLLLAFTAPDEYVIAAVDERGQNTKLTIDAMKARRWTRLGTAELGPHSEAGWRIVATRAEDGVVVRVSRPGADEPAGSVGPLDLPESPMGLSLDACDVAYDDIAWE